jgi:hypothetical protein
LELLDASDDVARYHGGEERSLVAEAGIDRLLSRALIAAISSMLALAPERW